MFRRIDLKYDGAVLDQEASWLVVSVFATALFTALVLVLLEYAPHNTGLAPFVSDQIGSSGVTNPITAVLLNFRAYDTLLEIAVLLVVVIAVLPLRDQDAPFFHRTPKNNYNLVLSALQRWVAPTVVLFGGYLLWAGAYQPGGAFQAGALLAGAGVLMFQTQTYFVNFTAFVARTLMALGLIVFMSVGLSLIVFEGSLLTYPPAYAGILILVIEGCATLSIAMGLACLYNSIFDTVLEQAA